MMTRTINRLIIKKDGKVYSFRCTAGGGAIFVRDADFVYIAFVADLMTNAEEVIIIDYTTAGRSDTLHLKKIDVTKLSRNAMHFFGNTENHIRSFFIYNDLDNRMRLEA